MARQIRSGDAKALLVEIFQLAENDYRENEHIDIPEEIKILTEQLFCSVTQAYREALVGCAVARIIDPQIDIRFPATEDGENAFSGRSLADKVITPFLREHTIPISASPYLSSLRGGARFVEGGEPRIQRDKKGFAALVAVVDYLKDLEIESSKVYLRYLLQRFILLRESGNIALNRIGKPNLDQLRKLISGLLSVKSGGRFAAFLTIALFQTISDCHDLNWDIEFQGINVADKASGAVGDITIRKNGVIILGIEVTERPVDRNRLKLIFDQKLSPSGLSDYLFVTTARPEIDAMNVAHSYTAVGHEMNFVEISDWLINNLSIIGPACRGLFQSKMIDLLSQKGVPAEIKVAWNDKMDKAIGLKSS